MRRDFAKGRLGGLLLEELCQRGFGMLCDYEPFLLRPTLGLFPPFLIGFFRHLNIVSHRNFSAEENGMPQPGIEPGSPEWARGCKPRLSANSSTGAQRVLDTGTVTPCKVSPVPVLFRPSSAALNPSSSFSSANPLRHDCEQLSSELPRFGESRIGESIRLASVLPDNNHITVSRHFFKQTINARDGKSTSGSNSRHHLRTCNAVVGTEDFLSVKHEQYCILDASRTHSQRNNAVFRTHDSIKRGIGFWHWRSGFRGRRIFQVREARWRRIYRLFRQRGNQVHESFHLLLHNGDRTFSLKFVNSNLELLTVGIVHRFLLPSMGCEYKEASCQCQP